MAIHWRFSCCMIQWPNFSFISKRGRVKIAKFITRFEAYLLTEKRVAENTFMAYRQDLGQFEQYCVANGIILSSITVEVLKKFLFFLKKGGLSARSLARKIATLKGLFMYGASRYGIPNYAEEIQVPQQKKELPSCLSEDEMIRFFSVCERDRTTIGKRNTVMLYLMYVTGARVTEFITLRTNNIHRENSMLSIEGKAGRQRMVPVPDSMMSMLIDYIEQTRVEILKKHSSDYLFPVFYGKKIKTLTRQAFWGIVKQLWKKAHIDRPMSPHTLRHSFATHMLQKGANLRSLQILLGHEHLTTVQVYTHMDTEYLRKIYNKKHPRSE